MTAIPEDWAEAVSSAALSGSPPHDPLDWLGLEVDRLADDLGLTFDQSEELGAALAAAFESMSNEELWLDIARSSPAYAAGGFLFTSPVVG